MDYYSIAIAKALAGGGGGGGGASNLVVNFTLNESGEELTVTSDRTIAEIGAAWTNGQNVIGIVEGAGLVLQVETAFFGNYSMIFFGTTQYDNNTSGEITSITHITVQGVKYSGSSPDTWTAWLNTKSF